MAGPGTAHSILLNPEQQRAVDHGDGPLKVLAGAGSGKTRVLVSRIEALVHAGTKPHRILAVTFTNKAAGEMRNRLYRLLGDGARHMQIGTFHSTCARLLRTYGEAIGIGRDFTIFDDDDQQKLMNSLLKEHNLSDAVSPRTLTSRIDRAKNRCQDPLEAKTGGYVDDIMDQIYPLYRDQLARENALDFNDLLLKVLELFAHERVGQDLRARFDHVLVDEFQDTNVTQYRLVNQFVKNTRNLTVVGDDDQSIYSWRGAEPRNLLEFQNSFPDAVVIKLEQNYRSTTTILDAANAVIAKNRDRHDKRLWSDREGGDPILWEEAGDEREEAAFIAQAILGLVADEGRNYGDFAVLYRTHAQSRVIEEMMRRHRIDYRIVGGVSFFQRKEIKDVRAYLRLMVNADADSCFMRICNVPTRGIGKTTVDRLRSFARREDVSMMEAATRCARGASSAIKPAARRKLGQFVDLIEGLRAVVDDGASVSEIIIQTVERSGYRERLEAEDTTESRERLGNLGELVTMASDYDDDADDAGTLVEFEEQISLASANDAADGRGESVTLMTVHAAKGLEFPVVFICGLEDGLFPSLRDRGEGEDNDKSLEEERRLAYVAITRAEDRLVLTNASMRRVWGELRMNTVSRFLHDIPSDCIAVREVPVRRSRPRGQVPSSLRRPKQPAYDEYDQSSPYDDVPVVDIHGDVPSTEGDALTQGSTVAHASFGQGRVLESRGSGTDQKLLIDFRSVGLKTVLARFVEPVQL